MPKSRSMHLATAADLSNSPPRTYDDRAKSMSDTCASARKRRLIPRSDAAGGSPSRWRQSLRPSCWPSIIRRSAQRPVPSRNLTRRSRDRAQARAIQTAKRADPREWPRGLPFRIVRRLRPSPLRVARDLSPRPHENCEITFVRMPSRIFHAHLARETDEAGLGKHRS